MHKNKGKRNNSSDYSNSKYEVVVVPLRYNGTLKEAPPLLKVDNLYLMMHAVVDICSKSCQDLMPAYLPAKQKFSAGPTQKLSRGVHATAYAP